MNQNLVLVTAGCNVGIEVVGSSNLGQLIVVAQYLVALYYIAVDIGLAILVELREYSRDSPAYQELAISAINRRLIERVVLGLRGLAQEVGVTGCCHAVAHTYYIVR